MSGSFPALNVCVLAAAQTLNLRPLTISSVGASQWGANSPSYTWLDMEQVLASAGGLPYRSIAVSPGGIEDRASGLPAEGDQLLREAMTRSGLPLIDPRDYGESLERRMALYREQAADAEISAYVNVGGSTVSVGTRRGKVAFRPGINRSLPRDTLDSVMVRFAGRGIPVIHLTKIDGLAERYGLPLQPTRIPAIGEGKIYVRTTHSRWLALATLGGLIALLAGVLRFDLGHRWFGARAQDRASHRDAPEPMV
jgi:poly-gamma-glutamate system protein